MCEFLSAQLTIATLCGMVLGEDVADWSNAALIEAVGRMVGAGLGQWPSDDLRRAFVAGVAWWEFHKEKATIWPSDRDIAEAAAERYYPGGFPQTAENPT